MKKVLITGVSGFIGSKVAQFLKDKNYLIIGLDKTESIPGLCNDFFLSDISEDSFSQIESKYPQIDFIIHAAAQSGGYKSLVEPVVDFQWNCLGTFNIIRLASRLKISKFIYLSSMAVYGNGDKINEQTPPNPISYYGASKLCGENYLSVLKEHNKIPFVILRLFATYGAGQDLSNLHQGILSIYLSQALKDDTINITGSKDRVRELVHVDDVVKIIEASLTNNQMNNNIYNVTNGIPTTPKDIIDEISLALDKNLEIKELEGYIGDQTFVKSSDSNKLQSLGLMPQITLKQGIEEFITNI